MNHSDRVVFRVRLLAASCLAAAFVLAAWAEPAWAQGFLRGSGQSSRAAQTRLWLEVGGFAAAFVLIYGFAFYLVFRGLLNRKDVRPRRDYGRCWSLCIALWFLALVLILWQEWYPKGMTLNTPWWRAFQTHMVIAVVGVILAVVPLRVFRSSPG